MRLSTLTYNILAQAYVRPGRYRGVAPDALDPQRRRALLLDTVRSFDTDLLLFQEVEPDAFQALQATLPEHQGIHAPKRGKPDGLACFFRPAVLSLQRSEVLHYRCSDPGYDHLATICHFRVAGKDLAVANTHLRWQPDNTPPTTHQGLLQMKELLATLDGYPPARIVGGDLNALSSGPVVAFAIETGLRLAARSLRPWDTALINGRRRKLDYLLYTPDRLEPNPRPLPRLSRDRPIPCYEHPSDHLPLHVDFTWC